MQNTGKPPRHARVDIMLEGGAIGRDRDPKKYDWRLGDQCAGIPIAEWQPSK